MDTRIVLAKEEYRKDWEIARLFMGIFGFRFAAEVRDVDVSKESLYETRPSSDGEVKTSLRTEFVLSLGQETCVVLVVDRKTSLQKGINGQCSTLYGRHAVEVYADSRKPKFGLTGTAETIIHELLHVVERWHGLGQGLHQWLEKGGTLEGYREHLLGRILERDNGWGLLPAVARLAQRMLDEYPAIEIVEGYRTPERQNELYKNGKGVTKAKAWESIHQYRCAFDYRFRGKTTKEMYPPPGDAKWNLVNVFARSLGLYSYGLEENWDDGHVQLTYGLSEKRIRSRDIDWTKYWEVSQRPKIDRDLMKGHRGEDVRSLQVWLNQNGFQVAKEGPGSPGRETDFFGELTRRAVSRWQASVGIRPAEGYFGPLSRARFR